MFLSDFLDITAVWLRGEVILLHGARMPGYSDYGQAGFKKKTDRLLLIITTVWPSSTRSENTDNLLSVSITKDITNNQQKLGLIVMSRRAINMWTHKTLTSLRCHLKTS